MFASSRKNWRGVYKLDRLTRSLLDFARIMEVFDAGHTSFVSVTQNFSSTTSMGRLTLNVLLSFAVFEREVTGERIRDKIRASKAKGMWMGGFVPFGYDASDRTLTVDEEEAATVRMIHALYLEFGNVRLVEEELARRGKITGVYVSKTGRTTGGKPFSRGHIYRILSNPIYVGHIEHKGVCHPGLHPPIVDRETFDAVQARLATNGHEHRTRTDASEVSLLAGLIFRADGTPLMATHAGKAGKRYRYYASKPPSGGDSGKTRSRAYRISASEIEPLVNRQLAALLTDEHRVVEELRGESDPAAVSRILTGAKKLALELEAGSASEQRPILSEIVAGIIIDDVNVRIELKRAALLRHLADDIVIDDEGPPITMDEPVSLARRGVETRLIVDGPSGAADGQPAAALVKAVARAHVWFDELTSGRAGSIVEIAEREGVSDRFVSIVLDLAFLAPSMVEDIVAGRFHPDMSAKKMMFDEDIPLRWSEVLAAR